MKTYEVIDLTGDSYLNPVGAVYDNKPGNTHQRAASQATEFAVHHDASVRPHDYDSVARYKQEAREHYNRLGPGLQYHYKIDNVGTIFKIRPITTWLYAVGSAANVNTINICLDGYFHPSVNQRPTREQYEALHQLLTDLSTNHPEFPADQGDVYPHRKFSATACCGDTLVPYVDGFRNAHGNIATPDVPFDWPSMQPAPVTPPAPPATDTTPEWKKNLENVNQAIYISQVYTHLDDLVTGAKIKEYGPGVPFEIKQKTKVGGNDYYITVYSADKGVGNGIPAKDLLLKNTSTDPKPPSDPDPNQEPPVVETPPTPTDEEQSHDIADLQDRVTFLEGLWKALMGLLGGIADMLINFRDKNKK